MLWDPSEQEILALGILLLAEEGIFIILPQSVVLQVWLLRQRSLLLSVLRILLLRPSRRPSEQRPLLRCSPLCTYFCITLPLWSAGVLAAIRTVIFAVLMSAAVAVS